jgi:cytochrome o ubiquinol oxidase operon protein cyoD
MSEMIDYDKAILRYVLGGVLAGTLTLLVFSAAVYHWLDGPMLAGFALICAAAQFAVHLKFFVELREDRGPDWYKMSFMFTILTALIIVIGSLWVMMNLNYNMGMSPEQMNEYMIQQGKKGF